nr:hypothetical protein [uncultured bacterium]
MKGPDDILRFWFAADVAKYWFNTTDAFDAQIRREFETTAIQLAAEMSQIRDEHPWETQSAEAHLALIIALDQFPRNMYRQTPAAFAWDKYAVQAAQRMVARKTDIRLSQVQRPFVYMPFMHSENLPDQEECVRLCDARLEDGNTLKFAEIHRDIIKRFGRFPHRNNILSRDTTPEEQAFLNEGGFSA